MTFNRRSFLKWAGLAAGAAAAGPLLGGGRASGAPGFKARRVVVVSIAGGLRQRESLGMAEGATMPNLFGDVPLIGGFGDAPAGAPKIAVFSIISNEQRLVMSAKPSRAGSPARRQAPIVLSSAL